MIRRTSLHYYYLLLLIFSLYSCQKDIKDKERYRKGNLTIGIDPSFLNLGTALADVFQATYPEAKLYFKSQQEDLTIADFINGKLKLIMVSRDLTPKESEILYNNTGVKYVSSQIACDATVFIVAKGSSIENVSINQLKAEILKNDNSFVFNGGNSSDLNNVVRKLDIVLDKKKKIKAFNNADEVIDFISKNKNYIGVVGFDILSNQDDPKVLQKLEKVKIVPVVDSHKETIFPTVPNLRLAKYPFTKRVYLLNSEAGFLLGSSFSRFSGSQRGQLIVTRSGLQPYFLYERRVQIN